MFCIAPILSQETVHINEKSTAKINYSQIFEISKIIKLETSKRCMISSITSIKVDGNRIFAFDDGRSAVFVFDQEGKFIKKVGEIGKGPGEMILPKGFTLDRTMKQIEILDSPGHKMIIYDYNGNYLKTNKSVTISNFEKLNSSLYIGYSSNYTVTNSEKIINTDLAIFNDEGEFVKEYNNIRNIPRSIQVETFSNLFVDRNGIAYLVPIFENCLFSVDQSLNIKKVCDFEFDARIRKGILNKAGDYFFAVAEFSKNKYPYFIYRLNVIKDNVSFSFLLNDEAYHFFWNMNTGKSITVKSGNFINDLALVKSFGLRGAFGSGLIDIIPANLFLDSYKEAIESDKENSIIQSQSLRDELSTLVKNISPNDNPILIFYKYK